MRWLLTISILLLFINPLFAQGIGARSTVSTVDLADSTTEYSKTIGSGNKPATQIQIRCRTSQSIRISFTSGGTAADYFTLPADQTYSEDHLKLIGTVYLRGNADSLTAEVMIWD